MRDKELLTLAAKVAGYTKTHAWSDKFAVWRGDYYVLWNPLEDDGDALRLAVAIPSLDIAQAIAEAWQSEESEEKRLARVRRTIVLAAVERGRV